MPDFDAHHRHRDDDNSDRQKLRPDRLFTLRDGMNRSARGAVQAPPKRRNRPVRNRPRTTRTTEETKAEASTPYAPRGEVQKLKSAKRVI